MQVVVVERWPVVRLGLEVLVRRAGHRVALAVDSAAEAVQRIEGGLTPDIVLLGPPSDSGSAEAVEKVLSVAPAARVVVILDGHTRAEVDALLAAGALAVLSKVSDELEVIEAFTRAERGQRYLSSDAIALLAEPPGADRRRHRPEPDALGLTEREREVLALLARGATNREIGAGLFIASSTVKTHLAAIYAKLAVPSRHAAVARAYQLGLLERRRAQS